VTADVAVSQRLQDLARELDRQLEDIAGEPVGFTLIVYTSPRASYISNVDRKVAIREMLRLLAAWRAGMPDIPAHEVS
jgi:hypothetical protein